MAFSLDQLAAFVTTAQTGSFSAAARKLGKAQSVVSTAVANLEIDWAVTLFERQGRYPVLTEQGEALLGKAKRILTEMQRLQASADAFATGVETRLTIAAESAAISPSIAARLAAFEQQFPQVEIEILTAAYVDVISLLEQGRAQLGLLVQEQQLPTAFEFHNLEMMRMCAVCSAQHPLARLTHFDWPEIVKHRQIVVAGRDRHAAPRWQYADSAWRTENLSVALRLVEAGIGWAELPFSLVETAVQQGELVILPSDLAQDSWELFVDLVWLPQQAMGIALQALRQQLIASKVYLSPVR
ncbi:LysR family transcriptional regulator [Salinivibrio sp. YCSC6]|uniref:LysR family transcriptional regulator n=1 Tax=Salinivibrio sp. YCSC6 TaxID=2003370 RepID=UPI000BBC3B04|nr:LysR family transcriptional regulator [Salinivibrio sp. YCSC6]PCE68077.1 hypothetical protein B6G00_07080 [Salinivibrio sp. YCSC6]QCF35033.1 LysR family transcriptional regulator [Salinivibrio sp. YCSC6]